MKWSGSGAWRMPRKNPSAMMDSKVPIYFESEANARETVRQRSNDSRDPATPLPVLAENLKKFMFSRTTWRLRLEEGPNVVRMSVADGLQQLTFHYSHWCSL